MNRKPSDKDVAEKWIDLVFETLKRLAIVAVIEAIGKRSNNAFAISVALFLNFLISVGFALPATGLIIEMFGVEKFRELIRTRKATAIFLLLSLVLSGGLSYFMNWIVNLLISAKP